MRNVIDFIFYTVLSVIIGGFLFALLIMGLALIAPEAKASDSYYFAGIGYGITAQAPDGIWRQAPFAVEQKRQSSQMRIGIGFKTSEKLSTEIELRDLGVITANLPGYVDDPFYDGDAHKCLAPCNANFSAYTVSEGRGIGISEIYKFSDGVSPYVRAGLFALYGHTHVEWAVSGVRQNALDWKKLTVKPFIGVGVAYRSVSVEWVHNFDVSQSGKAIGSSMDSVFINYKF